MSKNVSKKNEESQFSLTLPMDYIIPGLIHQAVTFFTTTAERALIQGFKAFFL
ncbi:hypothetical protein [Anaerosolibacter carboniphilus]|uniref:hypothetical protein n=1 Tax=Anaerosolibacter carboniphilus TaxID=1417629 RepID=UPI001A9B4D9B|nr:hypothetical protein [Anaerosolibacter carboniphilus]